MKSKYNCKICKYSTNDSSNFCKHNRSKKHEDNVKKKEDRARKKRLNAVEINNDVKDEIIADLRHRLNKCENQLDKLLYYFLLKYIYQSKFL